MLAPLFDEVEERFSLYVFELRRILKLHSLPMDGHQAVPALANNLTKSPELRLNVARMMRAVIRREREQISSVELLAVLLRASGQPAAQHADAQSEAAVEELLGFILEVRYPHRAGEENKSRLLRPTKDVEKVTPRRVALVEPSADAPAAALFQEREDGGNGLRKRVMLVAACAAVLALGIPLALHPHGASQKSMGGAVADAGSASGVSQQGKSSALHGTRTVVQREWLSGKTPLRARDAAARTASDLERVGAPAVPRDSARGEATGAPGRVQPVQPGMKDVHGAEAPLAGGALAAGSTNPAIVPVDLGTRAAWSREAGARVDRDSFVHSASAGIMAGNVISSPSPAYPAEALSAGVQGEVTVRAVVGRDGNVTEARVVSGPPLLREAAVQAVEQWQYRPYLVDGKPAAMATTAIVDFKLPTS